MKISDFYKVEREGAYFDPLVKRGLKSPFDFFTSKVEVNGKPALLIMNGLLQLNLALSEIDTATLNDKTLFTKEEIAELIDSLKDTLPFELYDYQRTGIIDMLTGNAKQLGRFCTGCLDPESKIDVIIEGYTEEEIRVLL